MDNEKNQALNELISSIQEKLGNSTTKSSEESSDLSSLFNSNNSKQDASFDPSTLLKIQKIMSKMQSNTPQKDLLMSLKPFLRQSRQDKMENYITILNIITILESLKDKGSD